MDRESRHRVLFSGYAKLPASYHGNVVGKTVGIIVIADIVTGVIIDAECTLPSKVAQDFIASRLIGHCLLDSPDQWIKATTLVYRDNIFQAIAKAFHVVCCKYRAYVAQPQVHSAIGS